MRLCRIIIRRRRITRGGVEHAGAQSKAGRGDFRRAFLRRRDARPRGVVGLPPGDETIGGHGRTGTLPGDPATTSSVSRFVALAPGLPARLYREARRRTGRCSGRIHRPLRPVSRPPLNGSSVRPPEGARLGLDVRELPRAAAGGLPDRLRAAGFEVEVNQEPHRQIPGATLTRVSCRRGEDVQALFWLEGPREPEECRVIIPNAWAWRASVRSTSARPRSSCHEAGNASNTFQAGPSPTVAEGRGHRPGSG
jgi:hypothetical protein